MKRRDFIGGLLIAWPFAAVRASETRRISLLGGGGSLRGSKLSSAFEQGLRDLGWRLGQDIAFEYRNASGDLSRLPGLAAELVDLKVDLILAASAPESRAAKEVTKTIPIVFAIHGDPIGTGDVQSLAHPGGNLTGLSQMHPELSRKQLELLKESVPTLARVAVIWNSANPAKAQDWHELNLAAKTLGVLLISPELRSPADLDGILSTLRAQRPDALIVLGAPVIFSLVARITNFASEQRLPAMYPFRQFVDLGGLMSYGADLNDLFRRAAGYVDKISQRRETK